MGELPIRSGDDVVRVRQPAGVPRDPRRPARAGGNRGGVQPGQARQPGVDALRITPAGSRPGIELVNIDAGPGLRDASAALRDGHSTSGTLGIGLGTIQRLADFYDLYSVLRRPGQHRRDDSGQRRPQGHALGPGIVGHQARTIRQFDYTAPPGAAVILHSDGISARWDPAALPGLNARDPLVIAATLLAQAGSHRDDAGVLVLRP